MTLPARDRARDGTPTQDREQARALVLRYGWHTTAFQIVNPGFRLWFSQHKDGVTGYVSRAGFRVVAGSPVCAPDRLRDIVLAFERDARSNREHVCYFGAEDAMLAALDNRGPLTRMLLGAQPVWNPQAWSAVLAKKASLRAQLARSRNKGVVVERWSTETASSHPALARCLGEWLRTRGLPALHFLIEPDTLASLEHRQVYVASRGGEVVGFLIASPIPLRNGWLIEQIIRGEAAPNGTAEILLDGAMNGIAATGATYVTLGLSPLSRRAGIACPHPRAWLRLLMRWTREHARRYYNFDGLDAFKAKLLPDRWEPLYAITSESAITPRMLSATAEAFMGTSLARFLGRGAAWAIRQEMQWLKQRLVRALLDSRR